MRRDVKKTIKEIQRREQVKQEAMEQGWRSRGKLFFKTWLACERGSHLEWLGFYDEAAEVRGKYKYGMKEAAQITAGMAISLGNSALSEGIHDSLNNTVTYGHIDNSNAMFAGLKIVRSSIYRIGEVFGVLFGKYKEDAWGNPVTWSKPSNLNKK